MIYRYIQNMNLFFYFIPEVNGAFTITRGYFILFIHYLFIAYLSHQNICAVSAMTFSGPLLGPHYVAQLQ